MFDIANFTKKSEESFASAVLATGLALGILFYFLVIDADGFGINLALVQAAFVAAAWGLSARTGHAVPRAGWVAAGFSLAFAAAFAAYASPLGLAVAAVGFLVSEAVFGLYITGHHADFHHPLQFAYSAFVMTPFHALARVSILRHLPLPSRAPAKTRSVLLGMCILVPVLFVFVSLFSSADPLFERQVDGLFGSLSVANGLTHVVGVAFWSVAFAAVLGLAFWKRATFEAHLRPEPRGHTESTVVLAGVIALFAAFLVFQASYLFGGEAAFQDTAYTFSEYARRGFHELVAVATIVLVLFLSLRYFHGDRASNLLRALHGILFAETLLVLVSAVVRMNLYVEAYGYTTARLFTYWFLAAVAALLVLAFVHLMRGLAQARFIRQGLLLVGVFALTFVLSAPDGLSFRLNADRILARGSVNQLDVLYASAEAYDTLVELERQGVTLERTDVDSSTTDRLLVFYYPQGDWRRWNWSKSRLDPVQPFPWFGCVTAECEQSN